MSFLYTVPVSSDMLAVNFVCCALITTEKNVFCSSLLGWVRTHNPLCGSLTWKSP
jgi:hypothetical protein